MKLKALFPAGACKGTTKQGKRCGIRDVHENQLCKWHGGEGQLIRVQMTKGRMERQIKRAVARSRRVDRLLSKTPFGRELLKGLEEKRRARKTHNEKREGMRSEEPQGPALPVQDAV
jgi:hypothetical protein